MQQITKYQAIFNTLDKIAEAISSINTRLDRVEDKVDGEVLCTRDSELMEQMELMLDEVRRIVKSDS